MATRATGRGGSQGGRGGWPGPRPRLDGVPRMAQPPGGPRPPSHQVCSRGFGTSIAGGLSPGRAGRLLAGRAAAVWLGVPGARPALVGSGGECPEPCGAALPVGVYSPAGPKAIADTELRRL